MSFRNTIACRGLAALFLAGCGGGPTPPALHPVTGTVLKGGNQITAGTVQFRATKGESPSILGEIDGAGKFELGTLFDNKRRPGAPVGEYQVSVIIPPGGENRSPLAVEIEPLYTVVAGDNSFTIPLEKKRKPK